MSKTFTRQAITCLVLIGCFMFPVCVVYSRCLPMKENSKAYWEEHRLAIERLRDPNYVPESEDEDEDEDGDGDGDADDNGEGDDDGDGDDE